MHVVLGTGHRLSLVGEVWGSMRKVQSVAYAEVCIGVKLTVALASLFPLCTHGNDFLCHSVISRGRERN